jgi:hypothetical protein
MMKGLSFRAAAGPTAEQQPPFRWSTSDWSDSAHYGMSDLQHFSETTVSFSKDSGSASKEFEV